jgi:hypothetical protein
MKSHFNLQISTKNWHSGDISVSIDKLSRSWVFFIAMAKNGDNSANILNC